MRWRGWASASSDAQGQFVGIAEVARQLQTSLGGLSDAQRQQALTTLFGSDAVRAASILMEVALQRSMSTQPRSTTWVPLSGWHRRRPTTSRVTLKRSRVGPDVPHQPRRPRRFVAAVAGANRDDVVNVFNDFASTPAWGAIGRNVSKPTDGLGGGLGGVADQLSAILDSIQPADVDRVFGRVSAAFETIRMRRAVCRA